MRLIFAAFFFIFFVIVSFSQPYKQINFALPVDIPIILSATFAELRPNHFHSGIDIKTQGVIGKRIYSIEDGFVSRIRISPYGYGKALYITHYNGFTSVYAHMDDFADDIKNYVTEQQYKLRQSEIDLTVPKELLKVKKKQVIGFGGNSGGSFGPHLHFEIRETITEHPINPLLFNFKVSDHQKPVFHQLASYDLNKYPEAARKIWPLKKLTNGQYTTVAPVVSVSDNAGFGVETYDFLDRAHNKCGTSSVELYVNDTLKYAVDYNKLSFAETREINSLVDYAYRQQYKSWIQKCFTDPNNTLSNYVVRNTGIKLAENKAQKITIISSDSYGNKSELFFWAQAAYESLPDKNLLENNRKHQFIADSFQVYFEPNNFYTPVNITLKKIRNSTNSESSYYKIGSADIPLKKEAEIYIKPKILNLEKQCIIRTHSTGKKSVLIPQQENGYLKTKTRYLGVFSVEQDITPPLIRLTSPLVAGQNYTGQTINFYIADNLSGIKKYDAFINKKWVPLEYDAKNRKLTYTFDSKYKFNTNNHTFLLEVSDFCGNKAVFKTSFFR